MSFIEELPAMMQEWINYLDPPVWNNKVVAVKCEKAASRKYISRLKFKVRSR